MDAKTVGLLVVFAVFIVPLVAMGIALLKGHGAFLIAGYNTMPKAERDTYDTKALCRAVGKLLLLLAALSLLFPAAIALDWLWLTWTAIGLFTAVVIAAVVYMNTGGRYMKK